MVKRNVDGDEYDELWYIPLIIETSVTDTIYRMGTFNEESYTFSIDRAVNESNNAEYYLFNKQLINHFRTKYDNDTMNLIKTNFEFIPYWSQYNVIADYAVQNGYSVAWDGDVSEKGFSSKNGIAIMPVEVEKDMFKNPVKEVTVTQDLRQKTFFDYSTTDDHLMHITGVAKDQDGTKYYYTKNSWGAISPYQGYVHMSEAYFNLKTVGILVHKDAVPGDIRKRLGI